jgi:hypothetical protein
MGNRYALGVIKYPSGKFGFAGRVPVELASLVFETEEGALKAAEDIGCLEDVVQLADCSKRKGRS